MGVPTAVQQRIEYEKKKAQEAIERQKEQENKSPSSTSTTKSTNTTAELEKAKGEARAKSSTTNNTPTTTTTTTTTASPSPATTKSTNTTAELEKAKGEARLKSSPSSTTTTSSPATTAQPINWASMPSLTGLSTKQGNGIMVPDYDKPIWTNGNIGKEVTVDKVEDAIKNLPATPTVTTNNDGSITLGNKPLPVYTDPKTGEVTVTPGIKEHLEAENNKKTAQTQEAEKEPEKEPERDYIKEYQDALDDYYNNSQRFNGARSGIDVGTAPQGNIYTGLNGGYYQNGTPLPLSTAPAVTSTFQPNPNFNVNSVMPSFIPSNESNTGSRGVTAGHTGVNVPTAGSEIKDTIANQQKNNVAPGDYGGYAQDKITDNGSGVDMGNLARNNTQATYDYLNNVADINTKLRNDIANEANRYIQGVNGQNQNYTNAIQDVSNQYRNDTNNYLNNTDQYMGNKGYQNALRQAQQGAVQAGYNAASTAQAAARNAGMSKAAAAAMGAGNAINGYNNALNQQQQMVQNNYNNALNTYGNQLNAAGNIYGQQSTAAGNRYGQSMGALNNSFATNANTMNNAASNMNNALGQDIVNRQNQYTNLYGNQDAITKLLKGFEQNTGISGLTNGSLGTFGGLLDLVFKPVSWLFS